MQSILSHGRQASSQVVRPPGPDRALSTIPLCSGWACGLRAPLRVSELTAAFLLTVALLFGPLKSSLICLKTVNRGRSLHRETYLDLEILATFT